MQCALWLCFELSKYAAVSKIIITEVPEFVQKADVSDLCSAGHIFHCVGGTTIHKSLKRRIECTKSHESKDGLVDVQNRCCPLLETYIFTNSYVVWCRPTTHPPTCTSIGMLPRWSISFGPIHKSYSRILYDQSTHVDYRVLQNPCNNAKDPRAQ